MAGSPTPSAGSTPPPDLQLSDLHFIFLQGVLDWLADPSQFVSVRMVELGNGLFWAISFLYFAYLFLKLVIESSSIMEYMGQLISSIITWGMVKFALDFYVSPLPGADGLGLLGVFNTGFNQVCAAMLGIDAAAIGQSVYGGFEAYMKIALIIWNTFPLNLSFNIGDILQTLASLSQWKVLIADFAITCLTMLALVACAGMYIAIYAYAMMLFAVGMMLGPIMIPWKLLSPFSYIADGWMKFMVLAGMYKVVALAIIHINELIAIGVSDTMLAKQGVTNGVINGFLSGTRPLNLSDTAVVWANIESAPLQHMFFSIAMLLFALLSFYMLMKVSEITSALLSGAGGGAMNFGRGGMASLGGSGAGGGGLGGGGGSSSTGQLAGMATGGVGAAATAAKSALGQSSAGRVTSAAGSAVGNLANKAVSAMPPGVQLAAGAVTSAGKNAMSRAKQTMSDAGKSVGQRAMQSPVGQNARQVVNAINRGGQPKGSSVPPPTKTKGSA